LPPYSVDKGYKIKSAIPLKWQYADAAGVIMDTPMANPLIKIFGPYPNSQIEIDENDVISLDDAGKSGLNKL
jgi:hypothetical protein